MPLKLWLGKHDVPAKAWRLADSLPPLLEAEMPSSHVLQRIHAEKEALPKLSQWMVGGDGWAYDIGFGGPDHVLASGADVNILILDMEVYSDTGGQRSESTPNVRHHEVCQKGARWAQEGHGRHGHGIQRRLCGLHCHGGQPCERVPHRQPHPLGRAAALEGGPAQVPNSLRKAGPVAVLRGQPVSGGLAAADSLGTPFEGSGHPYPSGSRGEARAGAYRTPRGGRSA